MIEAHAIAADDRALIDALARERLPTEDLAQSGQSFFAFRRAAECVGFGGFLLKDGDALLRSIVILDAHRGSGAGGEALAALITRAREKGASRAWLLTTGAAPFFAKHGFALTERDHAPEIVRASPQFKGLCPASAAFMRRDIGA